MSPPKYAVISPVPNQRSGIADYASGLVRGLRGLGNDVTVFTQSRFMRDCDSELGTVFDIASFNPKEWTPETTIYQIGNNSIFHDEIILHYLKRGGGIAHIHDFSLHHLFAHFTYLEDRELYYALVHKWYGLETSERIRAHHEAGRGGFWEGPEVLDYPLNEEVVSRAVAVIVHSKFAQDQIRRRFPDKPVYVVPQRYPECIATRRRAGARLKIASLGFVDPNKKVENTIHAVAKCRDRGLDVQLDIVGSVHSQCAHLPDLCRELKIDQLVRFWGAVSSAEFAAIYARADVCVVLRDPTVGETSAIVSRALQYGVPLIVNDVGSYSEVPPFAIKIPLGAKNQNSLADHLCRLATDRQLYEEIAEASYNFAAFEGTYAAANKLYSDVIGQISSQSCSTRI